MIIAVLDHWWEAIRSLNLRDDRGGDYTSLPLDRSTNRKHGFAEREICQEDPECQWDPCFVVTDDWCKDHLISEGWQEGYTCCLPKGHEGPHAEFSTHQMVMQMVHVDGRKYYYAQLWSYDEQQ